MRDGSELSNKPLALAGHHALLSRLSPPPILLFFSSPSPCRSPLEQQTGPCLQSLSNARTPLALRLTSARPHLLRSLPARPAIPTFPFP